MWMTALQLGSQLTTIWRELPPIHSVEYRMRCKNGQWKWISDKARIVEYAVDGKPVRMSGTQQDITERKQVEAEREQLLAAKRDIMAQLQLQAQFMQAQKMESVGRLAGGVAHDFNNLLNVILGYTEMALDRVDPSAPLYEDLQEILNAGKRSAEITQQLLAFARKHPWRFRSLSRL